jgi:hypothetical protein
MERFRRAAAAVVAGSALFLLCFFVMNFSDQADIAIHTLR